MPEEEKANPRTQARNEISDSFDAEMGTPEPKAEETQPVGKETEEPKAEPKQERVKEQQTDWESRHKELDKKYQDAVKGMNEAQRKAADLDKQFQQVKQYVDWNKLQQAVSGQQTGYQVPNESDKQRFFEDFANRGPQFFREQVENTLRQNFPRVAQSIAWQTKLDLIREDFLDQHPDLIPYEEVIWKKVADKIMADPQKTTLRKALKDSVADLKKDFEAQREEGKKEAKVAYEEKKRENIPSSEKASREPEKSQEEKPETLDDVVSWRRKQQEKYKSVRKQV